MTFKKGDMVLIVSTHEDPEAPKPGAIGTVTDQCSCPRAILTAGFEGQTVHAVEFPNRNDEWCWRASALRKIAGPGQTQMTPTEEVNEA